MNLRKDSGVTLIALTVTVFILIIITGAIIYNTKNQISMNKIDNLKTDIELLSARVDDYYSKYGELPILCEYTDKANFENMIETLANGRGASIGSEINQDDGNEYAVIELEKLGGINLKYGYEANGEYFTLKNNKQVNLSSMEDAIYVINKVTHQIYFPHGIFVDNVMYFTFNVNNSQSSESTDLSATLEIKETKEKNVQFILTTSVNVDEPYSYEIYVNDSENGTARRFASGSTRKRKIETEELETFFDIGIKDAYAKVECNGDSITTGHCTYTDLKINKPSELKALSTNVNAGKNYEGITITQIADIDLHGNNEDQWTPIGTETNPFKGTYDGGKFNIKNIYINNNLSYQGLFGYNSGTIINVKALGNITSTNSYIGGITATNLENGSILNTVANVTISGNAEVGGIVGNNTGSVSKSANLGTINAQMNNVGGIAGHQIGDETSIISNCYNKGNISSSNNNAGGIAGRVEKGTISNCYNIGTVSGNGTVGSIIGSNESNLSNCYYLNTLTTNLYGANSGTVDELSSSLSVSDMKSSSFLTKLNNNELNWKADYTGSESINSEYPILRWQ